MENRGILLHSVWQQWQVMFTEGGALLKSLGFGLIKYKSLFSSFSLHIIANHSLFTENIYSAPAYN